MRSPIRHLLPIGRALLPVGPLVVVTGLAFAIPYIVMLVAGSLVVGLYALLTRSDFSQNYAFVELAVPVLAAISGVISFLAYLLQIWELRGQIHRSVMYCLVAIGGSVIPLLISFMHYQNYRADPRQYVISSDKLVYIERQSRIFSRSETQQARRLYSLSRRIDDLLQDRRRFGDSLNFSSASPEKEDCAQLALARHTGLLCAHQVYVRTDRVTHVLELRADGNLHADGGGYHLSFLRTHAKYNCPFPRVLSSPFGSYPRTIPTGPLFDCLRRENQILRREAAQHAAEAERSRHHPRLPFGIVLLDATADVMGAKYSILEPVAPRAGLISLASALLVFAYFVLFASLVIDAKVFRPDDGAQGR